ncbi:phosphoglycerate kinase [Ignicoccus hospitalis]|uniref:Phosphoglycerate kinase n=1 Tax=Ignicoccus hospitalis (strain KIN4/I / DSM 18386 / JCM 14125) TaxID=453591 RepID=A8A956_IGNH4|nr:phosphoglycerate kinase [Ignicoccus hospitalis]ABU81458.1 phosphoglycerate kinase [Ignicoccus hospitalis KIN4/I]
MKLEELPTLDDIDVSNKKVLLRVDFNSPVKDEELLDDSRIRAHVPTIKELLEKGAAVVVISHQGRPGEDDFITLEPHAKKLSEVLGQTINFVDDVMGPEARRRIKELKPGEVLLLDNVRFLAEENINAPPEVQAKTYLVRRLAKLFDVYVNDAFATAHRSQPSVVGFPLVLPSAMGRVMEKEVKALSKVFNPQVSPKIFVLGGGKVPDTIVIIENLVKNKVADRILTTGLVAEVFLVAKGVDLGEKNMEVLEKKGLLGLIPKAKKLLLAGAPIETPLDFKTVDEEGNVRVEPAFSVTGLIRDVGPATVKTYGELMKDARVIVMRGPAGVMEDPRFREGTRELVRLALESGAFTIFGGGHLTAVIKELGMEDKVGHISTGGGALLSFLAGKELPALKALEMSKERFWSK